MDASEVAMSQMQHTAGSVIPGIVIAINMRCQRDACGAVLVCHRYLDILSQLTASQVGGSDTVVEVATAATAEQHAMQFTRIAVGFCRLDEVVLSQIGIDGIVGVGGGVFAIAAQVVGTGAPLPIVGVRIETAMHLIYERVGLVGTGSILVPLVGQDRLLVAVL